MFYSTGCLRTKAGVFIYMYIHKHTVFLGFCLFVSSCLLLVDWNKSGVVGVTNLYQFLCFCFFFLRLKKEALIKFCLEYV